MADLSTGLEARHKEALASAVTRAHQAFLRQQQAARNCVVGEKRRQQLQASVDKAQAYWCDLREAVALFDQLQPAQAAAATAAALHPFAASSYMSDNGPVQTYVVDVEQRLARVATFNASDCAIALQVLGLQTVVRKAIERRQRALLTDLAR